MYLLNSLNTMRRPNLDNVAHLVQFIRQKHHQIEVERKFVPTSHFLENWKLLLNRHDTLHSTGTEKANVPAQELELHDVYYECNDRLWRKGIWVRFRTCTPFQDPKPRSGIWNAKLRLNGNFANSRMMEVHGEQEVKDLLRTHAPEVAMSDLTMYADLITTRRSWKVPNLFLGYQCELDWEMNLVLDTVMTSQSGTFGCGSSVFRHEVGEIELTKETSLDLAHVSHAREAEKMDAYLARFIGEHPSLFDCCRDATGKLEAFTRWKSGNPLRS